MCYADVLGLLLKQIQDQNDKMGANITLKCFSNKANLSCAMAIFLSLSTT